MSKESVEHFIRETLQTQAPGFEITQAAVDLLYEAAAKYLSEMAADSTDDEGPDM